MSDATAERYLALMGTGREPRLALIACAAAFRLTDETARDAIEHLIGNQSDSDHLLAKIKALGCTWIDWNGAWYLAEDVRAALAKRLSDDVPPKSYTQLRKLLAQRAEVAVKRLGLDGQITVYESRLWRLEGVFQRVLTPGPADVNAFEQLADVWRQEAPSGRRATAAAADHFAPELVARVENRPPELLFLQGMAARERGDRKSSEQYFRAVWNQGREGDIFAIAAHLLGVIIMRREPAAAERAYRDSLRWYSARNHQGQVWHSLGNLLARNSKRWREAEAAYVISLKLLDDPESQGQVWHSLGNLLARNSKRWHEAEAAYLKSLKLLHTPQHQGQVYASLADGLSKQQNPDTDERAVEYALQARTLHPHTPKTLGVVYRILSDVYERQGKIQRAIESLSQLLENNHRLGVRKFDAKILDRIKRLRNQVG